MTQMQRARRGERTREVEIAAREEGREPQVIVDLVGSGRAVVPANRRRVLERPVAIGRGLRTKVNANLGTSPDFPDIDQELAKLQVALDAGADTVMDLSTGGDIDRVREAMIAACPVPLGTVPIYQATADANDRYGGMLEWPAEALFDEIRHQAEQGVDFMTLHCGVTREAVRHLDAKGRITDVVSRGGALLAAWMMRHECENPLYERFDELLDIAEEYDITLSLGDGLRPGCLADATDRAQVHELIVLGELVAAARERGVQTMVEGPGHVPMDQIEANVLVQKRLTDDAPFYVLGPLVTDIAPGYDHITGAIGGAIAAAAGADFLCYVTPAEHLGLPTTLDVHDGVIASRIAAHAADIVKGIPGAWERDAEMSRARKRLDWDEQARLALDPQAVHAYRTRRGTKFGDVCSMCGNFCAMRIREESLPERH
jgi:phosphomethylpyrimidine synthase